MSQFQISEIKCQENTWNPLNAERVAFYKAEFAANHDVAPISVDANFMLYDGRHRLAAAKELGHKTIEGDLHISTPLDLPGRKSIADAIDRDGTERAKNLKIADRRDPALIRAELENLQYRGAAQESTLARAAQYVVTVTGQVANLKKLRKQYEKATAAQPHNRRLLEEVENKIVDGEQKLALAKKNEGQLQKIVDSISKQIQNFLNASPGKQFPCNGVLLKEADESKRLERQLSEYSVW